MRSLAAVLLLCAGVAGADRGRGDELFAAGHYKEAAEAYEQAATDDVEDAESRYRLGVALAAAGNLQRAGDAWEAVLCIAPGHARARRNLELAHRRAGRDAALDDVNLAVPYLRALLEKGRAASALTVLDRMLDDPARAHDADLRALRGEIHLALGDGPAASGDFSALLLDTPRAARPVQGLARARRVAGDAAGAAYFERLAAERVSAP